ncbi:MAG: M23 family metallopeptidase [Elusimicrobiaceae bacterium]|jgi:murein DD-endopeptidase MepM/ murein hydrolase activator NlpD|nr:M23 family metallopeptidase [Elusimicrobiaceae bacterium]MBT3955669.1 M23 family metallopeptidase [Elusimicrobiaceae bacterium]MBT4008277.1 M23 family metallopeptidase [Elusimicrobiaceae bacterium]MBT4402336.1 M23 family metallopeptidase [Elusimicrobiaceae bacterium]MBT4439807.1 M23 family metallopeptidase [Elusimicrobiaceae bacterium]
MKIFELIRKNWHKKIDIMLVSRRASDSVKFKVSGAFLMLFISAWICLTIFAVVVSTKYFDYNTVKADNQILKTKFALIADEIKETRQYVQMAKKTEKEFRQMLGMQKGKYTNLPGGIKAGLEAKELEYETTINQTATEIDEKTFENNLKLINQSTKERFVGYQEIAWHIANKKNIGYSKPSIRPVPGRITSSFGYRLHPVTRRRRSFHYGTDLAGSPGEPIKVTADGIVRDNGWAETLGQAVLIDHGYGYSTLYGHVTEIKVKPGDVVKRGDVIATMGTTGRSTGVHLHYEVWKDGKPVNSRKYFK